MQTEDLIDTLAAELVPVSRRTLMWRLAIGLATGSSVSFLILWMALGLRPDLYTAMTSCVFWMKLAFPLAVTVASFGVVERLSRPGSKPTTWLMVMLPIMVVALVAACQLFDAPNDERMAIWLGHSAIACPFGVIGLSVPIFCGLLWSFQRLAPTRLALSGFGAGLLAGAASASVYAFTCMESSAAFVATWYSVGILGSGALGALVGPRLLRW